MQMDGILVVNFNEEIKVLELNDKEKNRFDLTSVIEVTLIQKS